MRYFGLVDFQFAMLSLLLGLVGLVFAAVAWGGYRRRGGSEPAPAKDDAAPEAEHNPVPALLVLTYVAVAAAALGYAAAAAVQGGPIGY